MQIKDARKWIPGNGPMSWLRIPDTEANKMPKSHHCASLFSPGCAPCWPAVQLLRELSRCDIRLGEIIALEQKRRIQILGQSIGKTVTIVQVRTVTRPLAEVPVGIGGETSTTVMPLFRKKASNAKIVLPPERVNKTMRVSSRLAALMQGSAAASINLLKGCLSGSSPMMAMSADVSTTIT